MKLYEIPNESKIRVETEKGFQMITMHHPDGMYSYCTVVKGEPDEGKTVHLSASTPLKKIGDHYEIE